MRRSRHLIVYVNMHAGMMRCIVAMIIMTVVIVTAMMAVVMRWIVLPYGRGCSDTFRRCCDGCWRSNDSSGGECRGGQQDQDDENRQ